jgi:uncharacterized protein (TIGR04141 family)
LKPGFSAENSLKSDHHLAQVQYSDRLPAESELFVLDAPPTQPWWRSYLGISTPLPQNRKGALLFLPASDRWFALTFGLIYHNLLDESIEYDFGLRVTLNCVNPNELKSTDTLEPGAARRKRTQMPTGADLTYFEFDRDSSVVKSITGLVAEEFAGLFKNATGANSLSVSLDVSADELVGRCGALLGLYESTSYKDNFPDLLNVVPVLDPDKIAELDDLLMEAVRNGDDSLYLAIPEMVDYGSGVHYAAFTGEGSSLVYSNVFLGDYIAYLDSHGKARQDITLGDLRRQGLDLCDVDGVRSRHYPIYRCLIFDVSADGDSHAYHFMESKWYRVENSYVEKLRSKLDPLWEDINLPDFAQKDEGEYSTILAEQNEQFICLDRSNISPSGFTQVEPCDLYRIVDDRAVLYHFKRSTFSSQLSHLFNQGANAIELLRLEAESLAKLKNLIREKVAPESLAEQLAPLDTMRIKVIFGMITHKDRSRKSENLPLFSRISLVRVLRTFELAGAECRYGFIRDGLEPEPAKPKKSKKKSLKTAASEPEAVEA